MKTKYFHTRKSVGARLKTILATVDSLVEDQFDISPNELAETLSTVFFSSLIVALKI